MPAKHKRIPVLLLLALSLLPAPAPARAAQHGGRGKARGTAAPKAGGWRSVAASLEREIPRLLGEADIPGLSVALLSGGDLVWQRGFGVKNAGTKEPVTDATVFEAASLSKPVFAYAVMKLVESGRLDLDRPLAAYLPGPWADGAARQELITARMVLSHRTGFPNWRPAGQPLQIHFAPGERFSYSGEGFVYLQKVVEHLTGVPLDEFMRKTVFVPLRMTSSSYVWQERYESLKAFAHNSAGEVAGRNKPPQANAAASLQTTAQDFARFVAAVMRRAGLKGATVREMLSPQVWVDEACSNCLGRPAGKLSRSVAWGLGWGLERGASGDELFWHWGDNGNTKAYVVASDRRKLGVVIFANGAGGLLAAREIVRLATGADRQAALAWLKYEPYDSPARVFLKDVLARGGRAIEDYRARRKAGAGAALTESQVNRVGYDLLGRKRLGEAVEVFKMNVEDFPASANVYDSLGEAYVAAGERELAAANYRRALALDPRMTGAADALKRLEAPAAKVDEKVLESYAGEYETPMGVLTITKEGGKLYGLLAGFQKEELVPETETRFTAPGAGAALKFVKDEQGRVAQVVITAGAEEFKAAKIK